MNIKRMISLTLALACSMALSVPASAELVSEGDGTTTNVKITEYPSAADLAGRQVKVATTVEELSANDGGFTKSLYTEDDDDIDVFASAKVYKITNVYTDLGGVAINKNGANYCGIYNIGYSLDFNGLEDYLFVDGYGDTAIQVTSTATQLPAIASIKVDGTTGFLNLNCTASGSTGTAMYPGQNVRYDNATITQTIYIGLKLDAPTLTIPAKATVDYFAQKSDKSVDVNGTATATVNPTSITLGATQGGDDDDDGDDDAYDFSAGTKHEYADGIVWAGASMTNFDTTANEYWAEFTATGVTEPRKTLIKNLPESEESITFDAVMWFAGEAKENVTFVINEYAIAE